MKTIIKYALVFMINIYGFSLYGQNWQRTLSSGSSGKNLFGTNDNFAINIFTNNNPIGTFTTAGQFGLGTNSPVGKIHINNDKVGSDSSFVVLRNGDVGIGTTTPNRVGNARKALTIASDIDGTTSATSLEMWLNTNSITSNSPVIGAMRFFAGTAANQNAIIAARISGTNTATGMLAFYTRPVGGGVTERMRIDENGKIGIGTFSPTSILDVNSNTTGEVFRTTSPVANTAAWRMLTGTGTTAEKFAVILNV